VCARMKVARMTVVRITITSTGCIYVYIARPLSFHRITLSAVVSGDDALIYFIDYVFIV